MEIEPQKNRNKGVYKMSKYTVFNNSACLHLWEEYSYKDFNELYKMIENGTAIVKGGKLASELNRLYKKAKMNVVFLKHKEYQVFKKEYNEFIGVV